MPSASACGEATTGPNGSPPGSCGTERPPAVAEDLIAQGHAFAPFIRYAVEPDLLYEGSEVDGWQVLELPGHADGHLGFLRDGVLIAGDHLLQRISPAVGLYPESRPDPLGDYLASLERTIELAPRIVYPGHGEPILDAGVRARELIEHHRRRLGRDRRGARRRATERLRDLPRRLRSGPGADAAPFRRRRDALPPGTACPGRPGRPRRGRPTGFLYWPLVGRRHPS